MGKKIKDSTQIEKQAVLALENYLINSEVVQTYLSTNDKEPFWDGHLYLYTGKGKTNKDFIGRVAVQIKGKEMKRFKNNIFSYPIKMSALDAYRREGVMYFVVQEIGNVNLIFYRSLTPIVIRNIKRINKGKNSVSVRMEQIPSCLSEMENLLVEFHTNCKKQISYADSEVLNFDSLKKLEVKKLTVVAHGYNNKQHIVDFLSQRPVYIYASITDHVNAEIPVGEGPMSLTFSGRIYAPVKVGDKIFFDSYTSIINKDSIIIECGNCLKILIPKSEINEAKVDFKNNSIILSDAIHEMELLLNMINSCQISLGDYKLNYNPIKFGEESEVRKTLDYLYKIRDILKTLGCNVDLELDKLCAEDYSTIDKLAKAVLYNEYVKTDEDNTCIMSLHLANLVLQIIIIKESIGKFKILNFFDTNLIFASEYNGKLKPVPSFVAMDKDMFVSCSNVPYDNIISAFDKLKTENPNIIDTANLVLLEMIHAIDKMEKEDIRYPNFIKCIKDFASWIVESETAEDKKYMHKINIYQIIKRERKLLSDEILELKKMLLDSFISDTLKCAIYILLDDFEMVDLYSKKLSNEDMETLKGFPIWNLRNASNCDLHITK